MPFFVTPAMIKAQLPPNSPVADAEDFLAAYIGRAERMLARKVPDLGDRALADETLLQAAQDVVVEAVLRVAKNPGSIRTEAEGGYQIGLDTTGASGRLYFTPEELAPLQSASASVPAYFGQALQSSIPCWRVI